ncbi:MAG: hypothetical protein RIB59_12285, partial [Rhodospirillales bacterium]
ERLNVPYPKRVSSGGWAWHPRFLLRFAPFHMISAITATIFFGIATGIAEAPLDGALKSSAIALLAMMPIIWGEISDSPQFARTYYPALISLLLPIGAALTLLEAAVPAEIFWFGTLMIIAASAAWNLRILIADVWPARMTSRDAARALEAANGAVIATYATAFNNNLADCLPASLRERLRQIRSLSEIRNGLVLIPGVTGYAANLQAEKEVLEKENFRDDPLLNDLIDSGRIKDAALTSFKTIGTSPYWTQESQIFSYLDLIHHRIGENERRQGRAWLIDAARAHEILDEIN